MARPTALQSILSPIVDEFARQLSAAIEGFTNERVTTQNKRAEHVAAVGRTARQTRKGGGARPGTRCYFPGCKNLAAPRFGMFCAAVHKSLPKAQKEKYRAQHKKAG
jgi:hypothetical protein